ncbi:MAG: PAS domain-containing protein, partial [Anaerolineaceae bacterium]|nr:PAS domain-containing protein [Anaerolineaceae bacterium]
MTDNFNPLNGNNDLVLKDIDFLKFFDLVSSAAVLYNRSSDQILSVNSSFTSLTEFDSALIINSPLSAIISERLDTNPNTHLQREIKLKCANNDLINVTLNIISLNKTNLNVMLLFNLAKEHKDFKTEMIDREKSFTNFEKIARIGHNNQIEETFACLTDFLIDLTGAPLIAIYKASGGLLKLAHLSTENEDHALIFSQTLNLDEIENLDKPIIWKENQKQLCKLHALAQDAGFKYLASIPLDHTGAWIGLILIAGYDPLPDKETLRFLSLTGIQVSAILEHSSKLEDSAQTIQKIKQVVQIEHAAIDNLEEGVIILTPDLIIAEMNPAAEIILGYNSKEVFKLPIDSILIGTTSLSSAFNSAKQGITTLVGNDLRLHNRNGKSFPAQVISIPVSVANKVISIIVLLKDTSQTELIMAKTQQLEQRAFLGEVTAIFAHEVKNPINSIMTGLQFIGMNLEEDAPHFELISRLQGDCQRLTHLMDSVLTFSKPVEFNLAEVNLNSLLPSIISRWDPRLRRLNIKSYYETLIEHPIVIGDFRALEQVFV